MDFLNSRFVRVYLLPGFILQSVIVAGGYGTGRELVEYFSQYGGLGGILGMLAAAAFFAAVIIVTYEFARVFNAYDYSTFFKNLLGRASFIYEIVYIMLLILVLSIVGSAAGEIMADYLNIPYALGMAGMIILVGLLNFFGREVVTKSLGYWSVLLYVVFIVYFIIAVGQLGGEISRTLAEGEISSGWALGGFRYSWYNLGIVPAVLFSVRAIKTRKEAVISGIIAPFIVIIPAFLFHLTFMGAYPQVIDQELPAYWMIGELGVASLLIVYVIVLFGTFVETGAGFIQGVIERLDSALWKVKGSTLSKTVRGLIGVVSITTAILLGTVGITALIAQGYGTMAWIFFFVYAVPVLTYGIYKIFFKNPGSQICGGLRL